MVVQEQNYLHFYYHIKINRIFIFILQLSIKKFYGKRRLLYIYHIHIRIMNLKKTACERFGLTFTCDFVVMDLL